jgi:hypothetical protein
LVLLLLLLLLLPYCLTSHIQLAALGHLADIAVAAAATPAAAAGAWWSPPVVQQPLQWQLQQLQSPRSSR